MFFFYCIDEISLTANSLFLLKALNLPRGFMDSYANRNKIVKHKRTDSKSLKNPFSNQVTPKSRCANCQRSKTRVRGLQSRR